MNFHHSNDEAPCKRMENALQQVADGSATGLKKAYVLLHAAQCTRCGNFLDRLRVTLETARDSREAETPDEAMERLRAKVQELEAGRRGV